MLCSQSSTKGCLQQKMNRNSSTPSSDTTLGVALWPELNATLHQCMISMKKCSCSAKGKVHLGAVSELLSDDVKGGFEGRAGPDGAVAAA